MIRFYNLGGCVHGRAPLLIPFPFAAAISGGASLLDSGLRLIGTNLTNTSNERIARETNETNMAINDAQLKYQLEQWKRETAYNDPSAQVQRLRAAGLNPQSLVTNGNAQPLNISSPIPAQSYQKENIIPENVFSGAVDAFNRGLMTREELTRQKRENYLLGVNASFAIARQISDLREQWSRIAASNADTEYKKRQMKDIQDRIDILQAQELRQANIDNQTLANLQADEQEKRAYTSRQDMLALEQKRHWSAEDAVSWFEAATHRQLADDTVLNSEKTRHIQKEVWRRMKAKNKYVRQNEFINFVKNILSADVARLKRDQQEAIVKMTYIQLAHEDEKHAAIFASIVRQALGIDLSNLLGPAAQLMK